jgi:purine-binding chemotaxis protein CheW
MLNALTATADRPWAAEAGPASCQYLRFTLADGSYAVPIDEVREILELAPVTPLPQMPPFVRGVMNLRGAVVPVIDLAARYGLAPAQIGRRSCIVVVDASSADHDRPGSQVLGLLVDAVHEVLDIDTADLDAAPALGTQIPPEFIAGMTRLRGAMLVTLHLGHSLDNEVLARMIDGDVAHHPDR